MMDNADPPVSFPYTIWPSVNREYSTSKQTRLRGQFKNVELYTCLLNPIIHIQRNSICKGNWDLYLTASLHDADSLIMNASL